MRKPASEDLAHRLADLRRAKSRRIGRRITQEEVARHVGVHTGTVTAWELGKQPPSGSNLLRLAEYYEITPEFLLSGAASDQRRSPLLSAERVTEFIAGIAPPGEAVELKIEALEAYRRFVTARAPVPHWWPGLKKRVEAAEI